MQLGARRQKGARLESLCIQMGREAGERKSNEEEMAGRASAAEEVVRELRKEVEEVGREVERRGEEEEVLRRELSDEKRRSAAILLQLELRRRGKRAVQAQP